MNDRIDTTNDNPLFDPQSIHVSFEERRWLFIKRNLYKLDDLVKPIADIHKRIHRHQQMSLISSPLTSSTIIDKVSLNDKPLYYISMENGCTDNQIDQFRLHYQQFFQLIFDDLCTINPNYRLLFIIIEGLVFSVSQTPNEYLTYITHEMNKCLTSIETYITSRIKRIDDFISFLSLSSLPTYTLVHTHYSNNIGILLQLLPKIYYTKPMLEWQSIVTIDAYKNFTISPEELRWMDYSMNMKYKRYTGTIPSITDGDSSIPIFGAYKSKPIGAGLTSPFPLPFQVLHSLPIIYPYNHNEVYSKRYPTFWIGDNHTNENSDALFQAIPIGDKTPEFTFVQRLFYKTVSEKDLKIKIIERIQNAHLWEKFSSHRTYMKRKNGNDNLNENWLFHGTKSDNNHRIMSHGFNRSYCRDYVYYGRGVYFSRYACYSCHYTDREDLSFVFLCRVLVGHHTQGSNDIRVPPMINLINGKQIQADSTTDPKDPYTIVCTFHDDQNYPEYIITYEQM